MKLEALALVSLVSGCGKSDSPPPNKLEAPSLSSDGKVKVPPGHELTYTYGDKPVKLEFSWLAITAVGTNPALELNAQSGTGIGSFVFRAPIVDATTTNLSQLVGIELGGLPGGISFGNAPAMATGSGGSLKLTEVTPTYVSGTFTAQACKHGEMSCSDPTQVTNGTFKAYRSALSDDAAFTRVMATK